ncbi:MAG: ATP-dependent DNA helicase [Cystobacterineae bacterium]|nr:ATP-dependent DNA helicase [Cystobacterineae bacterium]
MPPQAFEEYSIGLIDFFSKEGRLAQHWPGFVFRPSQQTLAVAIAHSLRGERWLLAESGTGTGKTLAYLVPALLGSKRTVIATSTRTLQDQLFFRDMAMLESLLPQKPSTALLKGRRNYLCLLRFEQHQAQYLTAQAKVGLPYVGNVAENAAFHSQFCLWVEQTETGERSEIEMPDNWPLWEQLCAGEENCLGHECPLKENCFLSRARKKAERAQLIIVNHALLFADLALKARLGDKAFFILPEYDALVVDEAHDMEAAATENFVYGLSNRELEFLSRDILRMATRQGGLWGSLGAHLAAASNAFFAPWVENAHAQQPIKLTAEDLSRGESLFQTLKALGSLCNETQNEDKAGAPLQLLARRIAWAEHNWKGLAFAENYVRWAQRRGLHWVAKAAPIDVGPLLQQNLYARVRSGVLTSATLTTGQAEQTDFAYVAQRLGFQEGTWDSLHVPSPFDYSKQAALYLPAHMPPPDSPLFPQALNQELWALISLFGGRTLALFTSLRQMQHSFEQLAPQLSVPALLQGSRPRQALLEAFVQTPSVLFGSHSFWEGVDIPGEALRLVTIDKIPFAVPTEPLTEARLDALRKRRLNPFSSYQLPQAALRLKQGFGRLIRNSDDYGVVALMDSRLRTKNYGEYLLSSLPRAKQLLTWMEVKHFHEGKAGLPA